MPPRYRIAIAGGGTGGHLYPGLAIADAFVAQYPGSEVVFFGTARGIENKIIPAEGYKLHLLPMRGLLRKFSLENVLFPFRLLLSVIKAWFLLRQFKPQLVIGTGGYVAGPPLIAAKFLGIKTAIQEQNSFPGLVNRKMGARVDLVCAAFADSQKYFTGQKHFYLTGNPVRIRPVAANEEARSRKAEEVVVLVFGGSQGANRINEVVAESLPDLMKKFSIRLIWVVGPVSEAKMKVWQEKYPENVQVFGYINDMAHVYQSSDIAVCRAGAMTLSELSLFGLPAILIPFPWATADHQTKNAQSVARAGAGIMIQEKDLTKERLASELESMLSNREMRLHMQKQVLSLAKPDATQEIVNHCIKIVEN
ncbi:MAG: undecaprenyldiphospho-muramoylpentapeptide beta-N-acetylglucosaminyltransferase [Deferribacteres bacterium]|nr:undecaprenyldiphospho-muramoylpentapeptide beta-N-acetylglucosaminyltransferase [candidate division KSB1 bacterium]MCB9501785.1 undecaprenyldiphospho-muramoylpentapeptide beta-N-acetylglucosaminyltransferase [Deferribacteres bacterium]